MGIFSSLKKQQTFIPPKAEGDYCLSKEEADKIKQLDIEKIIQMDSQERVGIFSGLLGKEKADWLNNHFEKDLILKNQKVGMLNWANNTDTKDKYRQEIIRKISKLEKVLGPKEQEVFLNELAELALGIGVTEEEAKTIFELSKKTEEAKARMENGGSRNDYEKANNAFQEYVNELKNS